MPEVTLEQLDEAECMRLISPGGIGRLCFAGRFDLTVLPVNYVVHKGKVIFRTTPEGTTDEDLRTSIGVENAEYRVAFEVDAFDAGARTGWSVLVQGPAHHADSEEERAEAETAGLETWAGDDRDHYIRITPARVTGRRIRRDQLDQADRPAGKIVVGVDGSASSKAALRWGMRQAELTGSSVEAVIGWEYPPAIGGFGFGPLPAMVLNFDEIAAKTLADSVAEVVDPEAPVRLSTAVVEGHPAGVLLKAAEGADLLVVGSRGHGGFAGALLGSVSQHCAQHASCPVVIIRDLVAA